MRALAGLRRVRATFDDGFRSAAGVFPELQQLGVPIELFVSTGYARNGAPFRIPELAADDPAQLATMTWDELRSHADRGIEIGSHTISHPHLPTLSDDEVRRELRDSKEEIEAELGRPCPDFAYPYGEHDQRVRAAVRAAGYRQAYALQDAPRNDRFAIRRLDLYRRHTPLRAVLRATPLGRL